MGILTDPHIFSLGCDHRQYEYFWARTKKAIPFALLVYATTGFVLLGYVTQLRQGLVDTKQLNKEWTRSKRL